MEIFLHENIEKDLDTLLEQSVYKSQKYFYTKIFLQAIFKQTEQITVVFPIHHISHTNTAHTYLNVITSS